MPKPLPCALAGALALAAAAAPARADDIEQFAAALKDYTGDYNRALVLTKLNTFKVGARCAKRLADKKEGALHAASFATRDLVEYAKAVTGEDWDAIEDSAKGEDKQAVLAPKIDAFKGRLALNVTVDGDDCDAKGNSLWLRYWTTLATSLKNNPPKASKVTINLVVTSKAREVTAEVSKDGGTFTFTAPKDIEAKNWSDRLDRPFRQLAAELPDDFAFAVKEATGRHSPAWVLTKLHTFKVGKKCRARLGDKQEGAIHAATFATREVMAYAQAVSGDDWAEIEGQSANDRETNRKLVAKMMDDFKGKLSITVNVEGEDCDAKGNSMWLRVWTTAATALRNHPPRAKKVAITIKVTAAAKDLAVATGADGATITITAPRDKEPTGWSDKIDAAFKKVARKK
jgi:hypothetical protein